MFKRIVCLAVVGCGGGYVFDEADFSLTVEVDKTEAYVGDTITVTARFENLSGKNIRVQAATPTVKKLENILMLMCVQEHLDINFATDLVGGFKPRRTFKKNSKIEKSIEIVVEELTDYVASAAVAFSVGKKHKVIWIYSDQIKINIKGE